MDQVCAELGFAVAAFMDWIPSLWGGVLSCAGFSLCWYRVRALERQVGSLENLSYFDYQTGLRSGRLFEDDAELICRSPSPIALLLIDLDDFAANNRDGYREGGDEKLRQAARIISTVLHRKADRIYRMHCAGDEFLVLLTPRRIREAFAQAERLRQALSRARVPACIGIGFGEGSTPRDPRSLLRLATTHKDVAKRQPGKNSIYPKAPPEPTAAPLPVDWANETTSIHVGSVGVT